MISAIGRSPFMAAPMIAPMIACSEIGVSRTRSRAEPFEQSLGRLEHPSGGGHVLAQEVDASGRDPSPARSPRATASRYVSSATRILRRPRARSSAATASGNGPALASSVARSTDASAASSIPSSVALSTPSASSRSRYVGIGSRASHALTSSSGRYFAGSARE